MCIVQLKVRRSENESWQHITSTGWYTKKEIDDRATMTTFAKNHLKKDLVIRSLTVERYERGGYFLYVTVL